jgi:hypothetical protein
VQNKAGFGVRIRTKSAPNVQGMFITYKTSNIVERLLV